MKSAVIVIGLLTCAPAFAQEPDAVPTSSTKPIFVVPDAAHPWAAAQIGSVLEGDISYQEGSLLQALTSAKAGEATGVVEIKLDTSSAFESGRVVCYAPNGRKLWEEKVMFNTGGGEERIARRFADALEKKVAGKRCSQVGA